ncbi:hypothetical protein SNEBB_011071 [Seison nebaliae]|nr:hypothetical protein SNEBB_011071 [Seison nebaliae]
MNFILLNLTIVLMMAYTIPFINTLECYECTGEQCNNGSLASNFDKKICPDGELCGKLTVALRNTVRGCTKSDLCVNTLGIGQFCCDKDLCNSSKRVVLSSILFFSSILVFISLLLK